MKELHKSYLPDWYQHEVFDLNKIECLHKRVVASLENSVVLTSRSTCPFIQEFIRVEVNQVSEILRVIESDIGNLLVSVSSTLSPGIHKLHRMIGKNQVPPSWVFGLRLTDEVTKDLKAYLDHLDAAHTFWTGLSKHFSMNISLSGFQIDLRLMNDPLKFLYALQLEHCVVSEKAVENAQLFIKIADQRDHLSRDSFLVSNLKLAHGNMSLEGITLLDADLKSICPVKRLPVMCLSFKKIEDTELVKIPICDRNNSIFDGEISFTVKSLVTQKELNDSNVHFKC